jgi:signal transduction histidine kinase
VASSENRILRTESNGGVLARGSQDDVAVVLDNLISNALRHSSSEVTLCAGAGGEWGWVSVEDDGDGIDGDEAERVFERFYSGSSSRSSGGSGLGLAVVRTLAERWNGEAWLENRADGGTRAVVLLPLARPARSEHRAAKGPVMGTRS